MADVFIIYVLDQIKKDINAFNDGVDGVIKMTKTLGIVAYNAAVLFANKLSKGVDYFVADIKRIYNLTGEKLEAFANDMVKGLKMILMQP